ncbi:MAG: hypothetical protein CUN53_02910 [Phototrophicales bacterium]|nr:MAG: hypothetical protein CUN53_02910 [Phototrophicales bacterium]
MVNQKKGVVKMKLRSVLSLVALLFSVVGTGLAQDAQYVCANGTNFNNAVILYGTLEPGAYTVTALGLNGFDPKLAVVDEDTGAEYACVDDSQSAATFTAALPTTGATTPSSFNAQAVLNFKHEPVNLVFYVAGFADGYGDSLLVIEGLSISGSEVNGGDIFSLYVTPFMTSSETPITAYMIGADDLIDPVMDVVDAELVVFDFGDGPLTCDDSGRSRCYGNSVSLMGSSVNAVDADDFDPYINLPWNIVGLEADQDGYLNYLFRSFGNSGAYIAAFHFGTAEPAAVTAPPSSVSAQAILWTTNARMNFPGAPGTVFVVSCPPNGTASSVWGTDIYTDDSSICTAAVHAGVITPASGGTFEIMIMAGQSGYPGSTRNGVMTSQWGSWDRSFAVAPINGGGVTGTTK